MLFDPARHEPLQAAGWDDTQVRQTIRDLVADIEAHRLPSGVWPVHPADEAGDTPRTGFKGLYLGSAGVLWALWLLQRHGLATLRLDPLQGLWQADADHAADPDSGQPVPSLFMGRAGIELLLWRLSGSAAVADRLFASVRDNIHNPTQDAFWGASGTLVAAWHLWQATGEARWRTLFLEQVDPMWSTWTFDPAAQCHLWTQALHGTHVQYLGAGHGLAGNVYPLLLGADLLDPARHQVLHERCLHALQALARTDSDAVNWPAGTFKPRDGGPPLMQWCHGAPGIVTALSPWPAGLSPGLDALLLAAGRAIWAAGPLHKGPGLCHGTAGNGQAFLMLYRRTGDAVWLQRARAFALHALAQQQRQRQVHGLPRCTLWTGDAGLAVFLWQCLDGRAGMPSLDFLQ